MVNFNVKDKVYVVLENITYYGVVLEVKDNLIKVDYTCKSKNQVSDWFELIFWKLC